MNKPYKRKLLEKMTQKIQTDKVMSAEAIAGLQRAGQEGAVVKFRFFSE